MLHRSSQLLIWLVLLAVLCGVVPTATISAQDGTPPPPPPILDSLPKDQLPPPLPQAVPLALVPTTPHVPGFVFDITIADEVTVGDTVPFTITLVNQATSSGEDVVVTLPVPDGTIRLDGPVVGGQNKAWQWDIGHMDGPAQQRLMGTLRVVRLPAHGALLLEPQVTARDLTAPTRGVGGALVAPRERGITKARYVPGLATALHSSDGRIAVHFPAKGYRRALNLEYTPYPVRARDQAVPPATIPGRRGLGTFFLDATEDQGIAVHQFDTSLTIDVHYTPEQLQALGLTETALTLFWLDETSGQWVALPTEIDTNAHVARAQVNHFSSFNLSDGSSPSAAYLPSLQGFQVSHFTGAASASIPIDMPVGPGGLKPALNLSYSSAASDGSAGGRPTWQAGPVGKGWSLNGAGFVALNKSAGTNDGHWDHFSLVFDGHAYDMVRGRPLDGNYDNKVESNWTWHATEESFVKLRKSSTSDTWTAWSKDGTRYEFTVALRWGLSTTGVYETYKWLLSRVVDVHGNVIAYDYHVDTIQNGQAIHPTYFLRNIYWGYDGATPGTGTARYRVTFNISPRWSWPTEGVDLNWEYSDARVSGRNGTPHEAYRIDKIRVMSWPSTASDYQVVREYNLRYAPTAESMTTDANAGQRVLTLRGMQRIGKDGSAQPEMTFTYGMSQGSQTEPTAGWNRLLTIDNGQGGRTSYTYEHVWPAAGMVDYAKYYQNYYRVKQVLHEDTSGQAYSRQALTTYGYEAPALNDYEHAATVVYARYPDSGNGDSRHVLARPEKSEFRGHYSVTKRAYDGASTSAALLQTTQWWFYQGQGGTGTATCSPQLTTLGNGQQGVPYTDPCYKTMSDRERWKGRVFQEEARNGASVLKRTTHNYVRTSLPFYGVDTAYTNAANRSNNYKRAGLWRAFNVVDRTVESTLEGGNTARDKTTTYTYESTYGNQTERSTLNEASAIVRKEQFFYVTRDDANNYLVDRTWQTMVRDGQDIILALTATFYDSSATTGTIGTRGLVTRTARYYDIPQTSNLTNITLRGQDTTFTYDAYGNQRTATTYTDGSTRLFNGSTTTYGAPGNGTAGRTTTTEYHAVFRQLPVKVTNPAGHVEQAAYDERMGTLIKVRGPNAYATGQDIACTNDNSYTIAITIEVSCAQYDVFGRMVRLVKPGNSTSSPTNLFFYYDMERPFRYGVYSFGGDATGDPQNESFLYYDGLGRHIQTRIESQGYNGQWIVTDTRYDALDRVSQASQPRTTPGNSTWWAYVSPGTSLYRPTTTTYDGLGRVGTVTQPDGSRMAMNYWMGSYGATVADAWDANNHVRRQVYDSLGRLIGAEQLRGNNGSEGPHTWEGNTIYAYDGLDRLTRVTDIHGNVTTLGYDSLGRKISMTDPDMGTWRYGYLVAGPLQWQTDAKNQTTWFGYDVLNRLTEINHPSGPDSYYGYDKPEYPNQLGRRTDTCTGIPGQGCTVYQRWEYDARGRATFAGQAYNGQSHHARYEYNSADRVTAMTYEPTNERVTTTYDAAGRPYSLCTSLGGCYVTSATYDALGQLSGRWHGNGSAEARSYYDPTARLFVHDVWDGSGAHRFGRSYWYDSVGNVAGINTWDGGNGQVRQSRLFTYDYLDRLTHAWTTGDTAGGYDEWYGYDRIGNLTSKAGLGMSYGSNGNGTGAGPHQARVVGGQAYSYDANGNLLSGGGRSYTWDAANRPTNITGADGVAEAYWYDADSNRVGRTRNGQTTIYAFGVWEDTLGVNARKLYTFNGQVVAQRDGAGTLTYLHGDHLGSTSIATNAAGAVVSRQEFHPWGTVREGGVSQTTLNYTGQRRDDTGLLYYNARYYDPAIGRFVSADTIVPGAGALTVGVDREQGNGPSNPQELNRYTYVNNNPINKIDPTGHCAVGFGAAAISVMSGDCTRRAAEAFSQAKTTEHKVITGAVAVGSAIGMAAGWIGGTLLVIAGGQAVVGAIAGSSVATSASTTAGTAATAACADGDCGNEANAAVALANRAVVPLAKFQDYIFKPGATHGKDHVFRSLGYGSEHSGDLIKIYQEQALAKFQQGAYTLGKLDQYGQRINITIDLPGIGSAAGKSSQLISGWMMRSDGTITLNTPFSGFPK